MNWLSYDLETAKVTDDPLNDWPLGISCAAAASAGGVTFWQNPEGGPMTRSMAQAHVRNLIDWTTDHTIATWNGAAFDFKVLAEESGMWKECAQLALDHVDLMLIVVAIKGHWLKMDTLAEGLHLPQKVKSVTLKDGTVLSDMSGALAPELWAKGEHKAVLTYLEGDVRTLRALVTNLADNLMYRWRAQSGRVNRFHVPRLFTVRECLQLPRPDNSWMNNPPDLDEMVAWALPALVS